MPGIEVGDTFDWGRIAARVEVDYFLVGVLEWKDDGICWERCERWVEFLRHQSV